MTERVKLSVAEYQKVWRENNPDKVQEYKERMIKWRDDNREHLKVYHKNYREKNREKLYHNQQVHKERKRLQIEWYKNFYDKYFPLINKVNDVCEEIKKGALESDPLEYIYSEWCRIYNKESETGIQSLSEKEPETMLQQETINEEDGYETEDSNKLE